MGMSPFQELLYTETIILITLYTSCANSLRISFSLILRMRKKNSFLKLIFLLLVTQFEKFKFFSLISKAGTRQNEDEKIRKANDVSIKF